jgi:hypothetical protein
MAARIAVEYSGNPGHFRTHMKRKTILLVAVFVPLVVGSAALGGIYWNLRKTLDDGIQSLKREVTRDFLDQESARFRSIEVHSSEGPLRERMAALFRPENYVDLPSELEAPLEESFTLYRYSRKWLFLCGEVNAKNKLGAYTGYKRFYISGSFKGAMIDTHEDRAGTIMCKTMAEVSKPIYTELGEQ